MFNLYNQHEILTDFFWFKNTKSYNTYKTDYKAGLYQSQFEMLINNKK